MAMWLVITAPIHAYWQTPEGATKERQKWFARDNRANVLVVHENDDDESLAPYLPRHPQHLVNVSLYWSSFGRFGAMTRQDVLAVLSEHRTRGEGDALPRWQRPSGATTILAVREDDTEESLRGFLPSHKDHLVRVEFAWDRGRVRLMQRDGVLRELHRHQEELLETVEATQEAKPRSVRERLPQFLQRHLLKYVA